MSESGWTEEKFRAMTMHSTDIISLLDGQGRLLFNSPATLRISGFTPEELQDRDTFELFAAAPESWSLVVCDVLMPDLDGPATVKALRAQRAHVPVLFVSGYTPDPSILTGSARTRFLGKPFSAAALTSALQQFLPGR